MHLYKYRIINKYRILLLLFALAGMMIYWGFSSGFFSLTIGFDLNAPDIKPGTGREIQRDLLSQILTLDNYMNIIGFASTILPILIFSSVILFYHEKRGLFSFRYMRGERQKKIVLSTIFSHAMLNAVSYYMVYIIYLSVGYAFIGSNMSYIPRNAFDGIFGQSFSANHAYLYYVAEGILSYFIGTFVYTVMACSIALFCQKAYQCIIYMVTYYWALQIILGFLRTHFMGPRLASVFGMFAPTYIYGFHGYVYHNPSVGLIFQIMSSLLFPILISMGLVIASFLKKEKLYE